MIPKVIHYCWFGEGPMPPLAEKCIASWKIFFPDYEIREWNEKNFDVNIIPYTTEAYRKKKYAFVSDYARFWVLYKYGGLYFDTDVEVIRPMHDIIQKGSFMGFEIDPDGDNSPQKYPPRYAYGVNVGLGCGFEKEHPFVKRILDLYGVLPFKDPRMSPTLKTIVAYVTEELMKIGLECKKGIQCVGGITVYPHEYFAPINVISGRLHITENTRTIHRYMGSWTHEKRFRDCIRGLIPEFFFLQWNKMKRRKYKVS